MYLAVAFAALGFYRVESPSAYAFKSAVQEKLKQSYWIVISDIVPSDWDTVCEVRAYPKNARFPVDQRNVIGDLMEHVALRYYGLLPDIHQYRYKIHFVFIHNRKPAHVISLKDNRVYWDDNRATIGWHRALGCQSRANAVLKYAMSAGRRNDSLFLDDGS